MVRTFSIVFIVLLFFMECSLSAYAQVRTRDGITFPLTYTIVEIDSLPPVDRPWKLIFEDEFNGTAPDDSKWLFTPTWGSVFSFGNKTKYDSTQNGGAECADPKNLEVSNGHIRLLIKKQEHEAISLYYKPDTSIMPDGLLCKRKFDYTSGVLFSKAVFGPGKFEIRCKLPDIDGVWPAFWLYGDCGQEFDVFEFLNEDYTDKTAECNKELHMTYHRYAKCDDSRTWCSHGTVVFDTIDYTRDFHTYSVEWDQYQVTWKVDGKIRKVTYGLKKLHLNRRVDEAALKKGRKYRLFKVMPDTSAKMYLIVSCGVTNYGNASKPLTRGKYPAVFEVDYVRAWTK
jgi:beta-glucanase (GH16 family)